MVKRSLSAASAQLATQKSKKQKNIELNADNNNDDDESEPRPKGLQLVLDGPGPMGKDAVNAVGYHLRKLARSGNPSAKKAYQALSGNMAKKAFALRLKLDPEASFCTVKEDSKITVNKKAEQVEDWHSLWEVGCTLLL